MAIKITLDMDVNKPISRIINREAKLFLASTAHQLMYDFIPFKTGTLADTKDIKKSKENYIEEDGITYNSPYARFLYYGKLMVNDNGSAWAKKYEEKHVVDKDLNFNKETHSLATSEWDKAMMASRKEELVKAMQKYFKRRGKA